MKEFENDNQEIEQLNWLIISLWNSLDGNNQEFR